MAQWELLNFTDSQWRVRLKNMYLRYYSFFGGGDKSRAVRNLHRRYMSEERH
jgi:hypothetical protein